MKLLAIALSSAAALTLSSSPVLSLGVPQASTGVQAFTAGPATPADERDPVCGMTVDPAKAKAAGRTSVFEGRTFHFCSDFCKKQFDADPAKYAKKPKTAATNDATSGCCCDGHGMVAGASTAGSGGMGCRRGR